jgi:hypothetical protein
MPSSISVRALTQIDDIDAHTWDALNGQSGGSYLCSHHFLKAFETTGCVIPKTGWQAQHLIVESTPDEDPTRKEIIAVVPLYVKGHSYGEFVFDWAWADAYQRNGLDYYPKWLCGVPFTPVSGARLLASEKYREPAAQALMQWTQASKLSSLHVLFTTAVDQKALIDAGCLARTHTQFHWRNANWSSFDAFLATLTQPKRKKIRAERRKVSQAGVDIVAKSGEQISPEDWQFFYRCYDHTYAMRGNKPYLTAAFFNAIDPAHCLLILASQEGQPVASALLLLDQTIDPVSGQVQRKLYGRYWGGLAYVDCLHFEVAYYAPIQWAIENNIDVIEGGAQGEHKMARGFVPVQTQSAHWLAHPGFFDAVESFLAQEREGNAAYTASLNSPFRDDPHD